MSEKKWQFLWYAFECLVGTAIGYGIYIKFPTVGAWSLISILLVISPDRKDALNLAINRIKANFVGAGVGLILFFIHPINLLMVMIGIFASMALCEWLKLQAVSRTAMIAVLIIIMHEPGQHFWDVALERALGVIVGCFIGVILTYIFHGIISWLRITATKNPSLPRPSTHE